MGDFSDRQAIVSAVSTVVTAIIGVCVAAGLPLSQELTTAIITLTGALTVTVLLLVGLLHHNSAKLAVARELAASTKVTTTSVRT